MLGEVTRLLAVEADPSGLAEVVWHDSERPERGHFVHSTVIGSSPSSSCSSSIVVAVVVVASSLLGTTFLNLFLSSAVIEEVPTSTTLEAAAICLRVSLEWT